MGALGMRAGWCMRQMEGMQAHLKQQSQQTAKRCGYHSCTDKCQRTHTHARYFEHRRALMRCTLRTWLFNSYADVRNHDDDFTTTTKD